MTTRPLVLLHGWSAAAGTLRPLADLLRDLLRRPVEEIHLADYLTMDDDVTFDDLSAALTRAWTRARIPTAPRAVDAVVHSTGALVVRDWLVRNFGTSGGAPLHRLLMLAPANFGSPLAHKGAAFLARATLGWRAERPFQTGRRLLSGLELASPWTWELARRDRRGPVDLYGPGRILCTVLAGNGGHGGIRAVADEPGGDGVVRLSTANMECAFLDADFTRDPRRPTVRLEDSAGETAFRILPGENHTTVAAGDGGPRDPASLDAMERALSVEDADFPAWRAECRAAVAAVDAAGGPAFQNTVVLVEDQFGRRVGDWFLEFFAREDDDDGFAGMFHRDALRGVHAHAADPAFRSFHVDCAELARHAGGRGPGMTVSVTALPDVASTGSVGYRSFTDDDIGGIDIPWAEVARHFRPHRTLLARLRIRREQEEGVFRFTPPPPAGAPGSTPAGG